MIKGQLLLIALCVLSTVHTAETRIIAHQKITRELDTLLAAANQMRSREQEEAARAALFLAHNWNSSNNPNEETLKVMRGYNLADSNGVLPEARTAGEFLEWHEVVGFVFNSAA